MALIFVEGFDYYGSSTDPLSRWTTVGNITPVSPGRSGSGKYGSMSSNNFKTLPGAYSTLVVGFAQKYTCSSTAAMLAFYDSNNASNMLELDCVGPTGALILKNGAGTTLATSAAGVVSTTNWHYLEIKVAFCAYNATTGSVTVKVDGVTVLSVTGVQVNGSTSTMAATCGRFGFLGSGIMVICVDDLYIADTSGTTNNDFLGDVNIVALMPAGAGHLQQWANTGGASQAASVGNAAEDGDTTYISDATVGDVSLFTLGALPTGAAAVKGVCVDLYARKDDAGTRQIAPVLSNGATDSVGNTLTMPSSYSYQSQNYDTNPVTGAAWAVSDFASLQAGVKTIA